MVYGSGPTKQQINQPHQGGGGSYRDWLAKRIIAGFLIVLIVFIVFLGRHSSKDSTIDISKYLDYGNDNDSDPFFDELQDHGYDGDRLTIRNQPSKNNNINDNRDESNGKTKTRNEQRDELLGNIKEEPAHCKKPKKFLEVKPGNKRIILLTSFPGSGNTWVRHMIQESTRIYTGSAYYDRKILATFPGEARQDGSVIVVKTHYPCGGCWLVGKPISWKDRKVEDHETGPVHGSTTVIYLIRSPFDAMLAEFNRMTSNRNHTGVLTPEMMKVDEINKKWFKFIQKRTIQWIHHVGYYFKNDIRGKDIKFPAPNNGLKNVEWTDKLYRPVYVIAYEQLVAHPALEIKRLIEWLQPLFEPGELPTPDMAGICAHFNQTGSYKRVHSKIFNPYTSEQKANICNAVKDYWREDLWGPCDGKLQIERKHH